MYRIHKIQQLISFTSVSVFVGYPILLSYITDLQYILDRTNYCSISESI